jgi:hypothetical protein
LEFLSHFGFFVKNTLAPWNELFMLDLLSTDVIISGMLLNKQTSTWTSFAKASRRE